MMIFFKKEAAPAGPGLGPNWGSLSRLYLDMNDFAMDQLVFKKVNEQSIGTSIFTQKNC